MKNIFPILFIFTSLTSFGQYTVSKQTVSSKPYVPHPGVPADASYYYDATLFKYRSSQSTAKALSYFSTTANRTGRFPITFNTNGTLSNGVIAAVGDKTSLLNTEALSAFRKAIQFDNNGATTINGTYNGQRKEHVFTKGGKISGTGTGSDVLMNASTGVPVFDTTIVVTGVLNTDIYASNYGFLPGAANAQNTKALQRISTLIESMSGGVILHIDKGTYTVGQESFANGSGKGYSYAGATLLHLSNCTRPVIIEGNGAVIKLANGMHYGSFNPTTGTRYDPSGFFADGNYAAIPRALLKLTNNKSVTVRNLTLDGNVQNMVIGGYFGDQGIQLEADGIFADDNGELILENVAGNYSGRDGLYLRNVVANNATPKKPVSITGCTFDGNARQGLTLAGANQFYCVNTRFINTGKAVNVHSGIPVLSAPAAGIDIEADFGDLIKNGVFEKCFVANNAGAAILNDNAVTTSDLTFSNLTVIGNTNYTLYGLSKRMLWKNCTVVGTGVQFRTAGVTDMDDPDNARFEDCTFTMDTTKSNDRKVYGAYAIDMGAGGWPSFTRCIFDAAHRDGVYGGYNAKFYDCKFRQDSSYFQCNPYCPYFYTNGNFYGTTYVTSFYPYGHGVPNPYRGGSKFFGAFYWNGADISGLEPDSLRKSATSQNNSTQRMKTPSEKLQQPLMPFQAPHAKKKKAAASKVRKDLQKKP